MLFATELMISEGTTLAAVVATSVTTSGDITSEGEAENKAARAMTPKSAVAIPAYITVFFDVEGSFLMWEITVGEAPIVLRVCGDAFSGSLSLDFSVSTRFLMVFTFWGVNTLTVSGEATKGRHVCPFHEHRGE